MERLATLENVLIHAAAGQHFSAERLRDELGSHAPDFELGRLGAQLMLLPTIPAAPIKKVEDVVQALNENSQTVRNLLDQVAALVELLLTVPASAATGERSFSALKRVQTCLRNRMTQKRLGQLLLLHVHKEETRQLDLNAVMGEFVSRTAERNHVATSRLEAEKDNVTIPMTVADYIVQHQAKPADMPTDLTDIFYDTTDDEIGD
ncbi:conserved hypothetical protein [Ixodes scapularis]|uniref:HAT C-terminal dimerisation domain-containing protein n=1 Tax=Ixodes scapularis TaxID=6945 RepID=B7PYU1_IXOSC|nr:conserved hypothetical protein [Ixodes scapularis]|eukprot:XP_002403911.1 conserved hypothetical protein [Ixodes scapularis]